MNDPKTGAADTEELRYSLYLVRCTLWNPEGTNEETALIQPDRRTSRRLMGQVVASPSVAKDEHDVEGGFFCFPDLSCQTHGQYRLRFVLIRINPANLHISEYSPILAEVLSDVFTVYTAKDFPGMRSSSALTRALNLQRCNTRVMIGNTKAPARKILTASQDHEDGSDKVHEAKDGPPKKLILFPEAGQGDQVVATSVVDILPRPERLGISDDGCVGDVQSNEEYHSVRLAFSCRPSLSGNGRT